MPAMPLWPWWLGALGFTTVAVLHLVVLRRPLGVSGLLRTALSSEKRREEQDLATVDGDDLQRALRQRDLEGAASPALVAQRAVLLGLVGGGFLATLLGMVGGSVLFDRLNRRSWRIGRDSC